MRMNVLLWSLGVLLLCGFGAIQYGVDAQKEQQEVLKGPINLCKQGKYQCQPAPPQPPPYKPVCNKPQHAKCEQKLVLLETIWRFGVCCKVINDPAIYYSDCSNLQEQCPSWYQRCVPEKYVTHQIVARCPSKFNKKGYRYMIVSRRLPDCCVCKKCFLTHHVVDDVFTPGKR